MIYLDHDGHEIRRDPEPVGFYTPPDAAQAQPLCPTHGCAVFYSPLYGDHVCPKGHSVP